MATILDGLGEKRPNETTLKAVSQLNGLALATDTWIGQNKPRANNRTPRINGNHLELHD